MRFTTLLLYLRPTVMVMIIMSMGIISCKDDKKQVNMTPEIPVVKVIQENVPVYQDFVGQVYGKYDIPIRARVSGFLDAIHFNEGTFVNKGELLYTIETEPYEAALAGELSNLAEAKTQLAKAESDLGRIVPLAKINAVSKSDLDATQAEYNAAVANVDAVESSVEIARINLSYCNVKSPIHGLIGKTMAKVGEFVGQNPNPVILNTVSTIDTIHVEFYLSESDYIGIAKKFVESARQSKEGDSIKKLNKKQDLELILSDGSVFDHKGSVRFIDRQVNPQTGTLLIQTQFPNPEELLRPGQFAKVRAKMKVLHDAIVVPQRCVSEYQGTHSIFVVTDDNMVLNKQITVGPKFEDYWVISNGLEANDKVVIDALQKVKDSLVIKPKVVTFKNQTKPNN